MVDGDTIQRRLLGDSFDRLPAALRYQFGGAGPVIASGRCSVIHGGSGLARLLCAILRLPRKGSEQPLTLTAETKGRVTLVGREIGDRRLLFHATTGRGKRSNRLVQRRGLWSFVSIALSAEGGIAYRHKSTRFLGLPLPGFLAPRLSAHEWPDGENAVAFDATITLPGGRRLIRLHGWFMPSLKMEGGEDEVVFGTVGDQGA